ncbi:hypothetical protein MOXK02_00960 [Moraxella sp. K02]
MGFTDGLAGDLIGWVGITGVLVQAVTVKQMLVVIKAKKESGFIASLINQNSNIIK